MVVWREAGAGAGANASRALTAAGWGASSATLAPLRTHALYDVRVRAFNAVGAGPPSAPLTATTLEGGESRRPCAFISRTRLELSLDPVRFLSFVYFIFCWTVLNEEQRCSCDRQIDDSLS